MLRDIIDKARRFALLDEETRDALEFFMVDRPTHGRFEALVLKHRGLSVKQLQGIIRRTITVLDGGDCSFDVDGLCVPVIDMAHAIRVLFSVPATAELLSCSGKPDHNCANWIPDVASGVHGKRSTNPLVSAAFGDAREKGSALLWEFFVDGGRLYSTPGGKTAQRGTGRRAKTSDTSSLGINVFATVAQFPSWFKERVEAWVWIATIPGSLAQAQGLPSLLQRVFARVQERVRDGVVVWDAWNLRARRIESHIGFIEADQQGEYDMLGLKRRYSYCWLCTQPKGDLTAIGQPVATLSDLEGNPNAGPKRGWGEVREMIAAAGATAARDLRSWLPIDTMHTFYVDGLMSRLVEIAFEIGDTSKLPASWLSKWQIKIASGRIQAMTGKSVHLLHKTCCETRRQLCAHAVWALEGLVRSPSQLPFLVLLRDITLLVGEEEREERLLDSLPRLRDLARGIIDAAKALYGLDFCNRSKIHRLLHLYEGKGVWSPSHGARNFKHAVALNKPPLKHFSMWRGERLQKHAKRAARSIYKACRDKSGRNTRFLRVQNQEAARWAFKLQALPAPFRDGAPDPRPGEFWLARRPVQLAFGDVMRFQVCRILALDSSAVRVCLYDSHSHAKGLPRLKESMDGHCDLWASDLVEEIRVVHPAGTQPSEDLCWLGLARPRSDPGVEVCQESGHASDSGPEEGGRDSDSDYRD